MERQPTMRRQAILLGLLAAVEAVSNVTALGPGFWFDDARIIERDVPVRQFAGERYFTVVRDAPGRGWWLLSLSLIHI